MDYYNNYEKFLRETADEVGNLVSDKRNLRRFCQQARLFVKQHEIYCDAVEQWEKKAATDPRLRDYSKGPPELGWLWTGTLDISRSKNLMTNCYWMPSEDQLPPDPFKWFLGPPVVIGASQETEQLCHEKTTLPYKEILLPCCYVLLITVHDNWCPPGFSLISEGIWSQEEEDWGCELRNAVFKDFRGEYKFQFKRKIEWALKQVKGDLPVKPAETGGNAAPAKGWWIWIWVKRHPHSYSLTGSFIFLILFLVLGLFKAQWRGWCWGTASFAFLVLILSLLGGRSR